MVFDAERVARAFAFDTVQADDLRARWRELIDLAVWSDLKCSKIGALPRLRKRLLEVGENLRSFYADRSWIPQPREQVKGAMAASLNLRDALLNLERSAQLLDGGTDLPDFESKLLALRQRMLKVMEAHEHQWAALLEEQYGADVDDED
ncbi:hypothetical protein HUS23_11390 [Ectothiorhodospiraceae bacterium 2226]|nr:hypothetical protein HUS23_11390 [Ectothiorhodospiraceae bacterium 2226]